MSGWAEDLRHALRALRRAPGFTIIAVGTLGLAIGVNAGIFSVVDTVLLDPLPYAEPDRLVYINASAPGSDMPGEFGVSREFWVHYRERSRLLEDVAIYNSFTSTLRADDRVERVRMSMPTLSLFTTLQVAPLLGRLPVPEDEDRVALISHALWTTWFGSDPAVIGRAYPMAGATRTIIGVMRPEFRFPRDDVLLWIPWRFRMEDVVPGRFGGEVEGLVARMRPGATVAAVAAELTGLARQLPERFGGPPAYARLIQQHRAVVAPLHQKMVGDMSRALWVLMGSVAIVLLIACANVANLFMVRAERRQRDLAVRRAIGAGRSQLFRSQMVEAIVVGMLGGVLALALAWVSVPAILRAAPQIPRLADVAMTTPTLLFTAALSVVAGVLCGLVPSLRASAPHIGRLRDGGRGSTRRHHRARDALVVAQTALALVLLIGSGLLIRSFLALRSVDPGYDSADILTFQIAPERSELTDGPAWARFHLAFLARVAALRGVESVGIIENVPLNEGLANTRFRTAEGTPAADDGTLLNYTWTAGDYFSTMGIGVLAGRTFTIDDQLSGAGYVVLSRAAADLLWPGQDPIGRRLQRGNAEWGTVIGVVEDIMQYDLRGPVQPLVYLPLVGPSPDQWAINTPAYVVRSSRAEVMAPEIRELVREVAPEAPMYRVFTMAGLVADSMMTLSFTLLTLAITSGLALILGTVGLYGVLSSVVAERRREIGVRMALGAQAARVRRMVVTQGARVVAIGVAIGAVAGIASTRALRGLLFDVAPFDGATFIAVSVTMAAVGMLASYVPARKASSIDPVESLRAE
jgi:predicted permease